MYKLVLLVFLMSCRNTLGSRNGAQGDMAAVISSSNNASIDFYQVIAKGNKNALFCPLSLNILLALTTTAARGSTEQELKSALHLTVANEDIEFGYKSLLEVLKDESLKIATRIFPNITADILPEFIKTARKSFDSDVQKVNYTEPKEAAKIINTFVENNTNNKIHDLVSEDSLTNDTFLLLVNAVHFNEDWPHKFQPLPDKTFRLSNGEKVITEMITDTGVYEYEEIPELDARVLRIPYKRNGYSMLIILPNKIDGLPQVEKNLKFINFEKDEYNRSYVKLTLPKFKMEEKLKLVDVCKEVGIKSLFMPDKANLSGLANGTVYVSDIIQKTYIQVDEKGVEAAAASEVNMVVSLMSAHFEVKRDPILFTADHAFIFVIMKDKMVLFLGRLCHI